MDTAEKPLFMAIPVNISFCISILLLFFENVKNISIAAANPPINPNTGIAKMLKNYFHTDTDELKLTKNMYIITAAPCSRIYS